MQCDFCKSNNITQIYSVPTSLIDSKIYSCDDCGLIQSHYGDTSKKHRNKSISSDANWGNIRHGKKIRLNKSIEVLNNIIDLSKVKNILDIGSNRGHFVDFVSKNYNPVNITAIEPDKNITQDYLSNPKIYLINDKFENCKINNKFNLAYCCHTLEHSDSASNMIHGIFNLLEDGGFLYIDVPSIQNIKDQNIVEEFFIDKHTFHFSNEVLINYLKYIGLEIIFNEDDGYNIIVLCKKINKDQNKYLESYTTNLKENRLKLIKIVKHIHSLCENKKVAIYGASKIYDALVRFGNLDTSKLEYIVDDYLYGYIDAVHNRQINKSDILSPDNTDIVLLLTRSSTSELEEKIKQIGIDNIINFQQLLTIK